MATKIGSDKGDMPDGDGQTVGLKTSGSFEPESTTSDHQPITIDEIDDKESLKSYLKTQPKKVSQIIAFRCSMRIVPYEWQIIFDPSVKYLVERLAVFNFRALLISIAAYTYPEDKIILSNLDNVVVASRKSFADSVMYSGVFPSDAVIAVAAMTADKAASAAALTANSSIGNFFDVWEFTRSDLRKIADGQDITLLPLWQGEKNSKTHNPFSDIMEQFDKRLPRNSPYRIIYDWYVAWLPLDENTQPRSIFDIETEIALARQDPGFWGEQKTKGGWGYDPEFDPDAVMDRIAELVQFPDHIQTSPQPIRNAKNSSHISDTYSELVGDSVNGNDDSLNRAPIALTLAARLNQIWDERQKSRDSSARWEDPFEAGFVVHVDAPWGGGKSTFTKYLTRILNPYRIKGPLPDWFDDLRASGTDFWQTYGRPWHIVEFNAWRHQHVTPPWWTFWQAIYKSCMTSVLWETNHRGPAWWHKYIHNKKPDTLPEPDDTYDYHWFGRRLWDWIYNGAADFIWQVCTTGFWVRSLLLVIFFALVYLLYDNGYLIFNSNDDGALDLGFANTTLTGLVTLLTVTSPILLKGVSFFSKGFLSGEASAEGNFSMGSDDPLRRFRNYFSKTIKRFRRPVLVIIDDLDRCNPDYIVELVRGMQTVLLSPRVVFILLGDRDWIEQAFAKYYADMNHIAENEKRGDEHEFGSKFVEKAIQLSMVLPDMQKQDKERFVRHILGVGSEKNEADAAATQALNEFDAELAVNLSRKNYAAREQANLELMEKIQSSDALPEAIKRSKIQELNKRASIKSSTDKNVEKATKHRLEAIADLLPPNPRQIKRIINTIVLLQEIARLIENVQIGDKRWQQLVRWIILADLYPKSWFTLSHQPELADKLYTGGAKSGFTKTIRNNDGAMSLLKFDNNYGENWQSDNRINAGAIAWLTKVMPPTSGQMLPP